MFTIENLCLAAEATVVMLLIALAVAPRSPKSTEEDAGDETIGWEPAQRLFLQTCIHRGLYLQQGFALQSKGSSTFSCVPFVDAGTEAAESGSMIPTPWEDRLTQQLNRPGFDAALEAWMAIGPKHRLPSCVSIVSLSSYSDLVGLHGAMVTEQAIRKVATHLASQTSEHCLISRYLPDRFLILHYASGLADCHSKMVAVREGMSAESFFESAGQAIPIQTLVCIAELATDTSLAADELDQLDQGILEAGKSGKQVLSRVEDSWSDSPPPDAPPAAAQKANTNGGIQSGEDQLPAQSTEPAAKNAKQVSTLEAKATLQHNNSQSLPTESQVDSPNPSSDISAVADADDIAALFAQINSNKATKSGAPLSTASAKSEDVLAVAKPVEANTEVTAIADGGTSSLSEAATADDIAALFASVKTPSRRPASEPIPQVETSTNAIATEETQAPVMSVPTGEQLSEAATADDIANLFATVKAATKKTDDPPAVSLASETTASIPMEQLNENASSDDIEALLAAFKK